MRDTYHEQLDALTDGLVEMSRLASVAVTSATQALVGADLQVAEQVITEDAVLNELYHRLDDLAYQLMARQQPVASDLRSIVTSLRMMSDLERAGDYAVHLAKIARRRFPNHVLPDDVLPLVREMGERAGSITALAGDVIRQRDLVLARKLLADDDAVDDLHRELFRRVLQPGRTPVVEEIVDITLVARYYERLADHAVAVSRAVTYLVTGEHAALTT